ncbi:MAG: SDR family NAD(P)-dependent oxidoreductase [Thermodesulfobacteriota bacterium]|jgi:NAD(P)-dependent dehydrogenase (short-subunit alcohol dehydrogenase family)
MKLKGKVALVAGGGQGIGEGISLCLAEEGADVAIADINAEKAKQVAEKIKSLEHQALALVADLTEEAEAKKTVRETVDFFGRIDILVNNIGGVSVETLMQIGENRAAFGNEVVPEFMYFNSKVWDRYYRLNLKSHVMLCQAVTPYFIKQRSGKIINISSVSGRLPEPGHMPYGSMKAGDISFTWSLASALAPYNVTVNCICPGFVYTPLWEMGATARQQMLKEARAKGQVLPPGVVPEDVEKLTPRELWLKYMVLPSTPLGREQTAEDMGRVTVFLVSDDAKNITGQVLHVDGGLAMR